MDTEEICKLIILAIVLFAVYHFFIRKSPKDEIKDDIQKEKRGVLEKVDKLPDKKPTVPVPPPSQESMRDNRKIEVHFVYANWCGHSQRAIPDFEKLVNQKGLKTHAGINLEFVMTESESPGMAEFKQDVKGFPTYMALYKEGDTIIKKEEVQVPNRTSEGIKSAAQVLPGKLTQPAQPKKVHFNDQVSGGGKKAEVHFVYAKWCGHSQRAIPDFEKLVSEKGLKTSSGMDIEFIMTEESSPGMSQFKGKIQGFPTYMVVMKENGNVTGIKELNVQSRTAGSIRAAAQAL